jgi:hypothetical protein
MSKPDPSNENPHGWTGETAAPERCVWHGATHASNQCVGEIEHEGEVAVRHADDAPVCIHCHRVHNGGGGAKR